MKITLCSSAIFFERLRDIEGALIRRGHDVLLPSMINYHHLSESALMKIQRELIRDHFDKIDCSDAIYVANYTKDKIRGYIGGNSFLEMGKAFDKKIPIFLMNRPARSLPYYEEILALQPMVIGMDWGRLERIIGKR